MTDEHLHGWKSIAAHLNRDRSTVIRWANERHLPVHSVPGGKSRTVYALKRELDTWLMGHGATPAPTLAAHAPLPSAPVPVEAPTPPSWSRRRMLAAGVVGLGGLAAAWRLMRVDGRVVLDPGAAARYRAAREDVASRAPAKLSRATASLRDLTARYPDHAGTHATLAEAYMLGREYGALPDPYAFAAAKAEAGRALAIDPGMASAHRVLGAVSYWRDGDTVAAGAAFRRALAAASDDPLAHLWYANALADNGEAAPAAREFAAAERLDPASAVIRTDAAWGRWSAGQSETAIAQWRDLQARHPGLATIADCLSVALLDRGDLSGYAAQLRHRAQSRGEVELRAYSDLIDRTLATGGRAAVYQAMLSRALTFAGSTTRPDHSWAAFVATSFGDRVRLLSILALARNQGQRWGAAGFVRRIAARWPKDPAIGAALAALRRPSMEPSGA
jgi:tetratricopeptide (TPR) repeat protein